MKRRLSEEQIIGFLREAEKAIPVKDLCRKHGFSDASFYRWRGKYGGMDVSDAKRLKALEAENARLKRRDARERSHQRGLAKKMVAAPARRELVQWMGTRGLSERRCLAVVGMSANSFWSCIGYASCLRALAEALQRKPHFCSVANSSAKP